MAVGMGRWTAPGRRETDTTEDTGDADDTEDTGDPGDRVFALVLRDVLRDAGERTTTALPAAALKSLCVSSVPSGLSFFFAREPRPSSYPTWPQHQPARPPSAPHAPQDDCSSTPPSPHRPRSRPCCAC